VLRERLAERFLQDRKFNRGFPFDWDPAHTARLVISLIWGIAVEAHSGASGPEIRQMVLQLLKMWPKEKKCVVRS
jgi:hypothetical protein